MTGATGAVPGDEEAATEAGSVGQGDVLREELARLLDTGGAPDAGDALDVLWIARLSGLDPVDWSSLRSGADPTAPAPPADAAPPPPEEYPAAPLPDTEPLAGIHLPGSHGAAPVRPGGAHAIRVAQPPALADALALTRALRPLRQWVPSARSRTLDVAATAAASGDTGLLLPILRPATERRFSVDLLIDTGTTMTVWHRLADELRTLLARHGAFADVRAWALNTDGPGPTLAPFRRGAQAASPTRHWKQSLADPAGRRAVLVLTDGVGPAWYGTELPAALAEWSARRPVAALQVLPSRLWHRTALRAMPVRARGVEAQRAAIEVRSSGPLPGVARGRAGAEDRARIRWLPTVEVSGDWLSPWARLVSGRTVEWVPLRAVPLTVRRPGPADPVGEPNTPAGWVERFEEGYSPEAFGLLRLLAAAPLSLPVMRLVQRTMIPSSTPMHLAEIFLSGLLVRRSPAEPGEDPDGVLYDFRDGVRETLLERLTRTESLLVLEQVIDGVSERVAATFGGVTDFGALVTAVEENGGLDGLELPEGSRAFAEVALAVIGGVGGDYREVAAKLARRHSGAVALSEPPPAGPVPKEREKPRRRRRLLPWLRSRTVTMTVGNVQVSVGVGGDLEATRAPGTLPSRVPELPPFHMHRSESRDVVRVLFQGSRAGSARYPVRMRATCVIEGEAGVGKTVLAADCAERLAPDFTMVRWIRADSRETLLGDLARFADDLGIPRVEEVNPSIPARRLADLRAYLTRHPGWLLVYDGVNSTTFASDPGDPVELQGLCLPPTGYGSVLVTSTDRTWWPTAADHLELTDPDPESALTYLRAMLAEHRGKAWKWSEELADLVGVVGTRVSVLAHCVSKLYEESQTVGSLAVEALLGRKEVGQLMGSLVWITRRGGFVASGVAVRSDAVLTSGFDPASGPFRIHRPDGRAFSAGQVVTRDSVPGLIMLRVEAHLLPEPPLSPPGNRVVGAAWYTTGRSSKKPVCTVALTASQPGRSVKGAALFDNAGNLHSIVASDRGTVSEWRLTPLLMAEFMAVGKPGAVMHVRDRQPEAGLPVKQPKQGPLFYLSYARTPAVRVRAPSREHRFFDDLVRQLAELTHTPDDALGFIDTTLPPGREWEKAMKEALATASVFVPLYSPRYFRSARCGMEWDAFGRRQERDSRLRGRHSSAIVPVLWASTDPRHLPSVSWGIQYTSQELGRAYADRGMLGLMEFGGRGAYERGVRHIAEMIVRTADATPLAPCDPGLFESLHNVFEDEES
ncbi:TIR-like protein FxsC [Streptomyces chartreusis]|uniref:TIR-like protein FxsC n=1 Tax=Streptomyces chartreusis TaxID=1969 RepID=UPI003D89D8FB